MNLLSQNNTTRIHDYFKQADIRKKSQNPQSLLNKKDLTCNVL